MTKVNALQYLMAMGSHDFISPREASEVCRALGVLPPPLERPLANTEDPRGLTMEHVGPYTEVSGISAWVLAEHIADCLGLGYAEKLGRGSRTRAAVDAVLEHFRDPA